VGDTVGVAGVEVAEGTGDAVAVGLNVNCTGSGVCRGIKLQAERKMISKINCGFRIEKFLLALVPVIIVPLQCRWGSKQYFELIAE